MRYYEQWEYPSERDIIFVKGHMDQQHQMLTFEI